MRGRLKHINGNRCDNIPMEHGPDYGEYYGESDIHNDLFGNRNDRRVHWKRVSDRDRGFIA